MSEADLKDREETKSSSVDDLEREYGAELADLEEANRDLAKNDKQNDNTIGAGATAAAGAGAASASGDDGDTGDGKKTKVSFFGRNRKKILGATGSALVIGALGFGFFGIGSIKPLALKGILERKAFAATEDMSEKMSQRLFAHWIAKKVLPGMIERGCTSTKQSKSCVKASGDTLVGQLFNGWKDARLEKTMADVYGIEIVREGRAFEIKIKGQPGIRITDTEIVNTDRDWIEGLNKTEARAIMKQAIRDATKGRSILYRYQVASMMERKYGIRRCVFNCENRDARKENKEIQRQARKALLVERFITPRSEVMGLIFNCALVEFDCAKDASTDPDGRRLTQFERDLQTTLLRYRATNGQEKLEKIAKDADDLRKNGFGYYIIKKMTNEAVAKVLGRAVPIVGQVEAGVQFVNTLRNAGPAFKVLHYASNSAETARVWGLLASGTDEARAAKSSLLLLGQLNAIFAANENGENGSAEAYQSRLVQRYTTATGGDAFANIFMPKAYAGTALPTSLCNNGRAQGPDGECPEFDLTGSKQIQIVGAAATTDIVNGVTKTTGTFILLDAIGFLIGLQDKLIAFLIPDAFANFLAQYAQYIQPFLGWFGQLIVARIMSTDPDLQSGGRAAEAATIGAEAVDAEFAQEEMGGYKLSKAEYGQIIAARETESRIAFESSSLWNRLTNVDEPMSFASQLAMATPSSTGGVANQLTNLASMFNPAYLLSGLFSRPVSAATYSTLPAYDIMGITKKGLRVTDPFYAELSRNAEGVEAKYGCNDPDVHKKWGDQKVQSDGSGLWEAPVANYCKAVQSTVCRLGVWFNESLCTAEQTQGANGNATAQSSATPTSCEGKPASALAAEIKANRNINLFAYDPITVVADIDSAIAGKFGTRGHPMNTQLLCAIAIMGRTHKFVITSLQGGDHSDASRHYTGDAVDFDNIDGGGDGPPLSPQTKTFITEIAKILPPGSGIGQDNCGNFPAVPTSIRTFDDTCNHLHVEVPRD